MDDVVERIGDPELPDYLVVVSESETNGWEQADGKPGFLEWRIYDALGVTDDDRIVFDRAGDQSTYDYDEATPISAGGVKWDGCANFSVGEFGNGGIELTCLAHVCGPRQLARLGEAMVRAYAIAAEIVGVDEST